MRHSTIAFEHEMLLQGVLLGMQLCHAATDLMSSKFKYCAVCNLHLANPEGLNNVSEECLL